MKIEWIQPDDLPPGIARNFAQLFAHPSVVTLIRNVDTEVRMLKVDENLYFPVTINHTEWNSSYVCSPYTAYVLYAKDELSRKIKSHLIKWPLFGVIRLLSGWLQSAQINRNVHINNFLLSTNPYPQWDGTHIQAITDFLTKEFPTHALIFRSLNVWQHRHLLESFTQNRYLLLGSRQVYIYPEPFEQWIKHNNNKQDRRIIRNKQLRYVNHDAMREHLAEAVRLYNLLYLEKYSPHNPQFTLAYFEQMHATQTIHFQGYTDSQNRLKAFAGLFVLEDTITSPLVGYDTTAPVQDALYIHAIQLIFDYKHHTSKLLNLSSGASGFKRLRGGKPSIEYSAVYVRHLPGHRQRIFRCIQWITHRIGIPLLEKYEL
jgi:hypothetical protein